MDSAQQSSFCSSPRSLPLQIPDEPTVNDDKNESQLSLAKKLKLETANEDVSSKQIIEDNVNADPVTKTEMETPILQYPNSSVSPVEGVFSIDHLLESILLECDRTTLLLCRRVCRRWAYYGSKALQRMVNLTFVHKFNFPRNYAEGYQFKPYRHNCIDDLTDDMIDSTEFPCNSFCFSNSSGGYGSYTPQPFLNAHGTHIKKLRFYGTLNLDHVRQLLLTQVPNLEQLILTHIIIFDMPSPIVSNETAEERAIRLKALFNDVTSVELKPIFKHLKVFEGSSSIPKEFTQQIIEQSPNLIEVCLPAEYFELLLKPVNRVHLLKKLVIHITAENIGTYESVANYDGDNLALQEIQYLGFGSNSSDDDNEDNHDNDILYPRVVNVMTQILEISRPSCQTLKMKEFLKNLQIPEMPQVKHLTVDFYKDDDDDEDYGNGDDDDDDDVDDVELPLPVPVNVFPKGVDLGETFPNLTTLRIGGRYSESFAIKNFVGDPKEIDGSYSPVLSVQNVNFGFKRIPDGSLFSQFSILFPNATLKTVHRVESEVEYDDHSDSDSNSNDTEPSKDSFDYDWDMCFIRRARAKTAPAACILEMEHFTLSKNV